MMKNITKKILYLLFLSLIIFGCDQNQMHHNPPRDFDAQNILPQESKPHGIYHTIANGETLWKISRRYNIQLSDILNYNPALDTRNITVGTRIFIPSASVELSSITTKITQKDHGYPWPVKGKVITEHSFKQPGIDILAKPGLKIKAIRSGKVLLSTSHFPGRWIIIKHKTFWSIYGNLGSRCVTKSQTIKQGQVIGTVGKKTIHLEFMRNGSPFNPRDLLGS